MKTKCSIASRVYSLASGTFKTHTCPRMSPQLAIHESVTLSCMDKRDNHNPIYNVRHSFNANYFSFICHIFSSFKYFSLTDKTERQLKQRRALTDGAEVHKAAARRSEEIVRETARFRCSLGEKPIKSAEPFASLARTTHANIGREAPVVRTIDEHR